VRVRDTTLKIEFDVREEIRFINQQHPRATKHGGVLQRLVITFRGADHGNLEVFAEIVPCGTDQVANIFDDAHIQLLWQLREGTLDQARVKMAESIGDDLHYRHTVPGDTLGIIIGLDISFDDGDAQLRFQTIDGLLEQAGFARPRRTQKIEGERALSGKADAVFGSDVVIFFEDVSLDGDDGHGRLASCMRVKYPARLEKRISLQEPVAENGGAFRTLPSVSYFAAEHFSAMQHTLQLDRPLAFFDLETTGISVLTDRIVEIAIVKYLPSGTVKNFVSRVNPDMPIPPAATAIHGISDSDVVFEPLFKDLARAVRGFLAGCDLSGYNVRRFDLPMLRKEFERVGEELDLGDTRIVDVQTIFHLREPRDLSAAYRYYCGKEHGGAHGALADVKATAEIFEAQLERYSDLPRDIGELEAVLHPKDPSWVDDEGKLIWENGEVVFGFGKYRGKRLRDLMQQVPDYLTWVLSGTFPDSMKKIIRLALSGSWPDPPRD
jgi:DNA polymerase-3 subunit epsilon